MLHVLATNPSIPERYHLLCLGVYCSCFPCTFQGPRHGIVGMYPTSSATSSSSWWWRTPLIRWHQHLWPVARHCCRIVPSTPLWGCDHATTGACAHAANHNSSYTPLLGSISCTTVSFHRSMAWLSSVRGMEYPIISSTMSMVRHILNDDSTCICRMGYRLATYYCYALFVVVDVVTTPLLLNVLFLLASVQHVAECSIWYCQAYKRPPGRSGLCWGCVLGGSALFSWLAGI